MDNEKPKGFIDPNQVEYEKMEIWNPGLLTKKLEVMVV